MELNKNILFSKVQELKERFNFTIPYWILDIILTDKAVEFISLYPQEYNNVKAWITYAAYICHLIPFPTAYNADGTGILRPVNKCLEGLMLFFHTHEDEEAIIKYSNSPNSKLPKLKFTDDSHSMFTWGGGTRQADFCEIEKPTHLFEAKYNYIEKGSISSTHNTDEILDCLPSGGINCYHLCHGQNMGKYNEYCVPKTEISFTDRKANKYPPVLNSGDLEELLSGELFLELDKLFNITLVPHK